MKEPFEIEPEDLARILVMIELDGIVWEGNAYTQHFIRITSEVGALNLK